MPNNGIVLLLIAAGTAILASMGRNGGGGNLVSIALVLGDFDINAGLTQQITAIGTFDDSSTANLTSGVTWTSSNPSIATVSNAGLLTGISEGTIQVTASKDGITSEAIFVTVFVQPVVAPTITITNPQDGAIIQTSDTAQTPVLFQGVSTVDPSLMVSGVFVAVEAGPFAPASSTNGFATWSRTVNFAAGADGPRTIVARVIDTANQVVDTQIEIMLEAPGPVLVNVPNVVGETLADATTIIENAGLVVGNVEFQ